jgi:hypothetical protein
VTDLFAVHAAEKIVPKNKKPATSRLMVTSLLGTLIHSTLFQLN